MRKFDLVVIGAGAAGVMAAGVAAASGRKVLLVEKMEKTGRKVRITGKGRCNLTNMRPRADFFDKVRAGAEFFTTAFDTFSSQTTVEFFEKIGVPLTVERGDRVFPASGKAWDIADAHIRWCMKQGAKVECFTEVTDILVKEGHITGVLVNKRAEGSEEISTDNIVIATGGASYPATGSTGDGYMLAHRLGHTIEAIRPSLTPLETETDFRRDLNGVALKNISAALYIDDVESIAEFGELEFTPFGVSGPIVLRLSRRAVDAIIEDSNVELRIDLKPALSEIKLTNRIGRETEALHPRATIKLLLAKLLPSALINAIADAAGLSLAQPVRDATTIDIATLVSTLKSWRIPVTDYRPFEEAIVTAGGVSTQEVDPLTLQSKIVGGLYFAGELLDIDADTGGYNLQIAYSTGYLAGQLK